MDICGNSSSIGILSQIFQTIKTTGNIPAKFFLLHGPSDIGKSTVIKSLSQDLLGNYFYSDFLLIKDLSSYLGKRHSLKIEVDQKNQNVNIAGVGNFMDYGVRDIINRASKSALGKYKIILLENIERMSDGSANAFLKTLEEPNENTIIFATTTNVKKIMDTIISRAFLIRFDMPCEDDLKTHLVNKYPDVGNGTIELVVSFSMGKTLFAEKMLDQGIEEFTDILQLYGKYLTIIDKAGNYADKMQILKKINEKGYIDIFLDAVIFHLSSKNKFDMIDRIITAKQMISANVGIDNAFFYIGL